MNDVLPKPFTKEGLLNMLEKHLSHLKKNHVSNHVENMGAPPHPLNSAKRSLKSEESPATSPATINGWNSPGNLTGVSPASTHGDDPYLAPIHGNSVGPSPYPVITQQQPGMPPSPMYSNPQSGMMAAPPRLPGQAGPTPLLQRRAASEISGGLGDLGPDVKRQQMYAPATPLNGMPVSQMKRPPGR